MIFLMSMQYHDNIDYRNKCFHDISWCTFNSYTMATRDLPDIYAQAEGIYIRQIPSGHGISNIYHSGMLT